MEQIDLTKLSIQQLQQLKMEFESVSFDVKTLINCKSVHLVDVCSKIWKMCVSINLIHFIEEYVVLRVLIDSQSH